MATRTPFNFSALLNPTYRVPDLSIEPHHAKPWLIFTTVPPSALSILLDRKFHARFSGQSTIQFPQGGSARLVSSEKDFDGHTKGTLFVAMGGPPHMLQAARLVADRARSQGLTVAPLVPQPK